MQRWRTKMLCECVCFPVINLRSLLLLYDTVYLALPIENFWMSFGNAGHEKKELVQLVSMGKVVLLLGNDETRYDRQVILDAYKESPDSVIGRRAMNAMMIAQLVEMKISMLPIIRWLMRWHRNLQNMEIRNRMKWHFIYQNCWYGHIE